MVIIKSKPLQHYLFLLQTTYFVRTSFLCFGMIILDGAHSIDVQNVTSNCKVAALISFFFSLYSGRRDFHSLV